MFKEEKCISIPLVYIVIEVQLCRAGISYFKCTATYSKGCKRVEMVLLIMQTPLYLHTNHLTMPIRAADVSLCFQFAEIWKWTCGVAGILAELSFMAASGPPV